MTDKEPASATPVRDEPENNATPQGMALVLSYDSATRELYGELLAGDALTPLNFADVRRTLDEQGYQDVVIAGREMNLLLGAARDHEQGRYFLGSKPEYTDITVDLDESNGKVVAILSASEQDNDPAYSVEGLTQHINERGYGDFFYEQGIFTKLICEAKKNSYGRIDIGQRLDAQAIIDVDEEEMVAWISIKPPMGGNAFDGNMLKQVLIDERIDGRCCDKKVLARIVHEKTADRVQFAEGKLPVNGKDTQFDALVTEVIYRDQPTDKTGKIDFREVKDFTLVEPGTELMRRHPAIEGINGFNVRGLPIPADHGEDIPWNTDAKGVVVSATDENLLLAEMKGHPVIKKDGVHVDDTLVVNNVSLTIGNIDFDGSVLVKGEVMAGMTIKASGDIRVNGVVTSSMLIAKNNIVVGCGVIGSEKETGTAPAELIAGGDIYAQYANLYKLTANGSIHVKEYISHCDSEAKQCVLVGQSGGKGKIFGGHCYASDAIVANAAGVDGGVKTYLTVGPKKSLQEQYHALKEKQTARLKQASQLTHALNNVMKDIKQNPTDLVNMEKAKKLQTLKKNVAEVLEKIGLIMADIERKFKENRKAYILVNKNTLPNVYIDVNGAQFFVRQEGKGGKFVKFGNDIRWEGLK